MTITLTASYDPTCRAIATFLKDQLAKIDPAQIEVNSVLDHDAMIGIQGVNFPVLQVYRLASRGVYLETSDIAVEYYLYDLNALWERPGILRLVEVAIAHLIKDKLPYSGLDDTCRVQIQSSSRGYLKMDTGEVFPYTRLNGVLQEVNVKSPVV